MRRVSSKVAIVTGGSRGLGAAQVRHLAEEGAKVVLTSGRSIEAGEHLAAEIGDSACFMRHDVGKAEDWVRVVAETERRFGPVTVLVNNAGIVIPASLEAQTEAQFREMFETNQLGTFLGMQAVIPSMRKAGGGSIINISSVAGLRASVASIGYGSTKYAIRGMTKTAAVELASQNIRVNVVFPGFIETESMLHASSERRAALLNTVPMKRIGVPREISAIVVFLASAESSYCTGGEYAVDGGVTSQ